MGGILPYGKAPKSKGEGPQGETWLAESGAAGGVPSFKYVLAWAGDHTGQATSPPL